MRIYSNQLNILICLKNISSLFLYYEDHLYQFDMNCVILQPSYIPWRGFFHQVYKADVFVFYDDINYDKHGWRNRNRLKTHQGTQWLTIPVSSSSGPLHKTPINRVKMDNRQNWRSKHWKTIQQSYSKAPYFAQFAPSLEEALSYPRQKFG